MVIRNSIVERVLSVDTKQGGDGSGASEIQLFVYLINSDLQSESLQ